MHFQECQLFCWGSATAPLPLSSYRKPTITNTHLLNACNDYSRVPSFVMTTASPYIQKLHFPAPDTSRSVEALHGCDHAAAPLPFLSADTGSAVHKNTAWDAQYMADTQRGTFDEQKHDAHFDWKNFLAWWMWWGFEMFDHMQKKKKSVLLSLNDGT